MHFETTGLNINFRVFVAHMHNLKIFQSVVEKKVYIFLFFSGFGLHASSRILSSGPETGKYTSHRTGRCENCGLWTCP